VPEPGRPGRTPRVVAVVGPTATGKSDLALLLAERLHGEIVNADSMQLYRGMDIGTAKLPPAQRRGIPHHVLDVWPVQATASVAEYQSTARTAVADVEQRGRRPILVGGSGLYVRAVLDDLRFPGTDPYLRAQIETEMSVIGPAAMHARLAELDPRAAAAIDPTNSRRVIRALEVIELTGDPVPAALPQPGPYAVDALQIGLDRDGSALDQAIVDRTRRMFAVGLVDEVRRLEAEGLRDGRTASRALGYAQVLEALSGPTDDPEVERLATAEAATIAATRRFARRQRAWFRRDHRITWIDADDPERDRRLTVLLRRHGMVG
jgi:tRNA dimethylallyltransferase